MTHSPIEAPVTLCVVCSADVPGGRLPLVCAVCGGSLHPACAARVERGPGWGNRRMVCPACAADAGEGCAT